MFLCQFSVYTLVCVKGNECASISFSFFCKECDNTLHGGWVRCVVRDVEKTQIHLNGVKDGVCCVPRGLEGTTTTTTEETRANQYQTS